MYKGILIICAVVFSACSLNKELVSVKYHPAKGGPSFYIDIPKVYTFQGFAGSHETEHRYVYSDSSLIYITNFSGGGPNYDNIRKQGTFYKLFDIEHSENDTLLLAGTDSLGLYWKNKSIGRYSVGYQKVPKDKKELFDKVVLSFKKK